MVTGDLPPGKLLPDVADVGLDDIRTRHVTLGPGTVKRVPDNPVRYDPSLRIVQEPEHGTLHHCDLSL